MFSSTFETFSQNCDELAYNLIENSDKHCSWQLGDTNKVQDIQIGNTH